MSGLTLGTAQLGMPYGAVNKTGKPSRALAVAIVRSAVAQGVSAFDTARAYGDSEEILGEALTAELRPRVRVITKLDPFGSLCPDAGATDVRIAVEQSVRQSCNSLRTDRLETLLLHRWQHYRAWNGEAWRRLLEFLEQGTIAVLGASVSEPQEAIEALQEPMIRHLQIPLNLLDWRWKAAGVNRAVAARPDVVVHARSPLLQGILIHPATHWPVVEGFEAAGCVRQLESLVRRFQRGSISDLCFAYVRSQAWVRSVVAGCETKEQLDENVRLFQLPKLDEAQCGELEQDLGKAPEELLNPAKWNRRA
jgi:aryl-alcohol dehydrogenase-like predicted oxidoreductase